MGYNHLSYQEPKQHSLNQKRHSTDANIEIYLKVELSDKEFKAGIIRILQQSNTYFLETNENDGKS